MNARRDCTRRQEVLIIARPVEYLAKGNGSGRQAGTDVQGKLAEARWLAVAYAHPAELAVEFSRVATSDAAEHLAAAGSGSFHSADGHEKTGFERPALPEPRPTRSLGAGTTFSLASRSELLLLAR